MILDLIIKSKIIGKVNKCVEMTLNYNYSNSETMSQTWKFDIRKESEINFWFASEAEEVSY